MSKKIKTKSLHYVLLGEITGSYNNRKCETIKEAFVLAHAKYYFFNRGKIKYFVNAIDKTKYFPKEKWEEGICAAYYFPVSTMLPGQILKKGYIYYNYAVELIEKYKKSIKRETRTISQREGLIEEKSLDKNTNLNQSPAPFGKILTDKYFKNDPVIGRDRELESIIITLAQQKKHPILVGNSGVGKTSIVDKLAYCIKEDKVPQFLKNRKIIEVSAGELVSNTKYRGELEEKMLALINYLKETNSILFIDEIHTIYGTGSTDKNDNDIASILKTAIDRDGIKVIGTTTKEEYEKYFSSDALKRRFEPTTVEEPKGQLLYEIINYTFDIYSNNYGISIDKLDKSIIDILIELTKEKHRTYNDKVCNPDLIIGIIDKAFATALVSNSTHLNDSHIINAIKNCERIYESAGKNAINAIISLASEQKVSEKGRILKLPISN